ncbi:MAG: hypothetical protein QOC96_1958 [Acidobacteriota bacterium]|nr:hypothetical protein [Acidobacteriota bacterium]
MGKLFLRSLENPIDRNEYAEARGVVAIPLGRDVILEVSIDASSDLTPLALLASDDLQVIAITCRRFDGLQLQNIQHLTGLLGLALWETDINDAAFLYLSGLINLHWLDIGDTKVTDEGLAFVENLTQLEELSLLNTEIGNQGLLHLEKLKRLKRLDLMSTRVDDDGFEILKRLTSLKSLRITDTNISYTVYAKLKRALPKCQIKYHEFA